MDVQHNARTDPRVHMHASEASASGTGHDDDIEATLLVKYEEALRALNMTGPDSTYYTKTIDIKEAINLRLPEGEKLRTKGGKPSRQSRMLETAFEAAVERVFGTNLIMSSKHMRNSSHLVGFTLEPVAAETVAATPTPTPANAAPAHTAEAPTPAPAEEAPAPAPTSDAAPLQPAKATPDAAPRLAPVDKAAAIVAPAPAPPAPTPASISSTAALRSSAKGYTFGTINHASHSIAARRLEEGRQSPNGATIPSTTFTVVPPPQPQPKKLPRAGSSIAAVEALPLNQPPLPPFWMNFNARLMAPTAAAPMAGAPRSTPHPPTIIGGTPTIPHHASSGQRISKSPPPPPLPPRPPPPMPGSPSPHNRPRAAPASAPPNAKRSRDDASRPSADAQLWVELTDAALNDLKATKSDLKATKTKLASVQAVVLQQNTLIKQQTSTITEFVDTRKPSRVVEALKGFAKLAPTVTTDVIAKTALTIATRLDTEAGGG